MTASRETMKEMVFWGVTGQARVLRECMIGSGLKLVALFDNNDKTVSPFAGVPLCFGKKGFEDWMAKRALDSPLGFLVAIGGDKGEDRLELQRYLESHGLTALLARHATAFVADDVMIGVGSQILARSTVCVGAVIGRGCIINTGAIVDHECRIHEGSHICPGAHLAGCVEVERCATIGTGAVILPRIRVGQGAVVGAGAVVVDDVPPYTVVCGNPARSSARKISKDEPNR